MHVLPDRFEMCTECEELVESGSEPWLTRKDGGGSLCGGCSFDYDLCESCQELVPLGTVIAGACVECREKK